MKRTLLLAFFFAPFINPGLGAGAIDNTDALAAAIRDGGEGSTIEIAPGIFELEAPLELKSGMTPKGAGMDKTILTHTAGWKPSTRTLPDQEMTTRGMDTQAYLIRFKDKAANVTVSDLTLRGPQLHGAIYGWENQNAHLHHLRIQDTLWTGIRTFLLKNAKIHDCEFIDAGGRWERGEPGLKGGITGGAIFSIWMADSEIAHNRFVRTQMGKADLRLRQGGGQRSGELSQQPRRQSRPRGNLDQRGFQQPGDPEQPHYRPHHGHPAQGRTLRVQSRQRFQNHYHPGQHH
jgi:hypothetical protein